MSSDALDAIDRMLSEQRVSTPAPVLPLTPTQLAAIGMIDRKLEIVEHMVREAVNQLDERLQVRVGAADAKLLEAISDRLAGIVYMAAHACKILDRAQTDSLCPPARARGTDTPTPGLCPSSLSLAGGDRITTDLPSAGEASPSHLAPPTSPEFSGPGGPHKSGGSL